MKANSNKKFIKKRRSYKLPIIMSVIVVLIAVAGVLWLKPSFISRIMDGNKYDYELSYRDNGTPGSSYYIRVDTKTRALLVEIKNYCSAVNCPTSTDIYGPTILTNVEYSKIFSYIKSGGEMRYIGPIFESSARDQEPFDGHLTGSATTQREFANQWLDDVIKEIHK